MRGVARFEFSRRCRYRQRCRRGGISLTGKPEWVTARGKRGGPIRWIAALVALCAMTALLPQTALARRRNMLSLFDDPQSLLREYSMTTSLLVAGGSGDMSGWRSGNPATPLGMGIRYHERNGFITGTVMALIQVFACAMAASGPKSVETWSDSSYRYTRTTYYSQAEKQRIMDNASNSASNMMSSPNQSFDLEIYSRNLGGDISGYRATMMLMGFDGPGKSMIDWGFGFGSATAAVAQDGHYLITDWTYFGIPIRWNVPVGPLLLFAQFDWNWWGHSRGDKMKGKQTFAAGTTQMIHTAGFPLRIGASAAILGRLYVEAVALTPSITSGAFGYTASAGARF